MTVLKIARAMGLAAAFLALIVSPGAAQDTQVSIMTGSPSGTYIQFGRDMQNLMAQCGQKIEVVESADRWKTSSASASGQTPSSASCKAMCWNT